MASNKIMMDLIIIIILLLVMCSCNKFLVLVNGELINNNELMKEEEKKLSWTRKVSEEAEAVASVFCSGHGRAFMDGLVIGTDHQKLPACECNSCYAGPTCSQFLPDCVLDNSLGSPLFMEPFWRKHAASSSVLVAGWHRMSYSYSDGSTVSEELVKRIMKIHALAGNAVTDGKYIIFGAGSTQLLNAAVNALAVNMTGSSSKSSPAKVVASTPYYPVYKSQTEIFDSTKGKFSGDTDFWKKHKNPKMNFIEFVTTPNNPDGGLKKAVLEGDHVKHIYDLAYYWPSFTPIPYPMDEEIMIFTLSKLTGHAGARFGWALIKDKGVYDRMTRYIQENTYGDARESQLRVLKILDSALKGKNERKLFDYSYGTMKKRWSKLIKIFSASKRLSLQELVPKPCKYLNHTRMPTPAYAWVKCNRKEDRDCNAVLKTAKIKGREGSAYNSKDRYVRLSVICSRDDFNLLQNRLRLFVSQEDRNN